MRAKVVIVLLFIAAAGGILWYVRGGGKLPKVPAAISTPVEITMLYGTEKREWVEAVAAEFAKQRPDVKVVLVGKGSLESVQSILDGKDKPTVWSPADGLALRLLQADWQTKNRADLFATAGEDAPQALVITPLVFAIWEDRADVLLRASGGHISWKAIHKAVASNQGWPAVGGKPEWGFVKLGHTDPMRSNSGLQTLLLMTLDYYGRTSGLQIADVLDPKYQTWIAQLERGVGHFETSTGTFMTDMIRFGPSKYDIAVVYENLAVAQLENAQGRWGNLRLYYPPVTLWSDHPAALLQAEWVTEPQRKAARAWLAFLHSRPMQERALSYGFRPADPTVPIRTGDAQNPFTRYAPYGVQIEIPPVATLPEAPVIRNLLTMWSRVVAVH
jgi:ABC-type molybdate transport system substrate-binding protein